MQSYADYDAAEVYPPNEICIIKFRIADGIQEIFHEFLTIDGEESTHGQGLNPKLFYPLPLASLTIWALPKYAQKNQFVKIYSS